MYCNADETTIEHCNQQKATKGATAGANIPGGAWSQNRTLRITAADLITSQTLDKPFNQQSSTGGIQVIKM